jgi:DNA-binding transcriptional MocR family regulator
MREEIARRSAEVSNFVRPAEVLVTTGATEGLSLAIRSVARPDESIAVQAPVNPRILALLDSLHVRVVELDASPTGRGTQQLEDALGQHPDLRALISSPAR